MASKWEKAEQEAKKHTTTFYCHFCAMKNVYFTLSCALIAELRWKAWEYFECDFCDHIGVECQGPSMIAPLKQGRLKMHKRISVFFKQRRSYASLRPVQCGKALSDPGDIEAGPRRV